MASPPPSPDKTAAGNMQFPLPGAAAADDDGLSAADGTVTSGAISDGRGGQQYQLYQQQQHRHHQQPPAPPPSELPAAHAHVLTGVFQATVQDMHPPTPASLVTSPYDGDPDPPNPMTQLRQQPPMNVGDLMKDQPEFMI